jgi:hypothetical protein
MNTCPMSNTKTCMGVILSVRAGLRKAPALGCDDRLLHRLEQRPAEGAVVENQVDVCPPDLPVG